jgi:hypothetical protein
LIFAGDNPDLLFRFEWKRWGIACKRLYSPAPERFRDTVTKAIDQIEKSEAEIGLVFISVVNLMRHNEFYKLDHQGYHGMSKERLVDLIEQEEARLVRESLGQTDKHLASVFSGKKALPGVVHYLGTTYMTGIPPDTLILKTAQRAFARGSVRNFHEILQAGLNSTSSSYRRSR